MMERSSMDCGFRPIHTPVMPVDSIWKTPAVLPCVSMSMTFGSLSVTRAMEKSGSVLRISRMASSMTVILRRPRKSILRSPSSSSVVMVYSVTIVPSLVASGT